MQGSPNSLETFTIIKQKSWIYENSLAFPGLFKILHFSLTFQAIFEIP